ncbi:MAG: hypothetical protein QNJ44_16935 [Rhodobacter sp.]|nr:hypothetical protein [Rhodobacter sp.]
MHKLALAVAAAALAACAPAVPDSGAGVGFQNYSDYNSYRNARDDALADRTQTVPPPPPITTLPPQTVPGERTVRTQPPAGQPGADTGNAPASDASARPVITTNNPRISDEQNFEAVAERESIESDAERLRAQREAYQVIEATAVPTRSGNGPNIVQFAISTSNPVGQKLYRRGVLTSSKKYLTNCAKYASPDLAQEAFLRAGGPDRDRLGLDPDGDGFACAWDPTPFRRIARS